MFMFYFNDPALHEESETVYGSGDSVAKRNP